MNGIERQIKTGFCGKEACDVLSDVYKRQALPYLVRKPLHGYGGTVSIRLVIGKF